MKSKTLENPMQSVVLVPLNKLHEDPVNARQGNVQSIVDSLKEFGQHRPCVVQKSTGRIIAGNHLYKAAKALGWERIGVFYVDDDDKTALRRGIADNATSDQATWDIETLAALIQEAGNDIPGVDDYLLDEIDSFLADPPEPEPEESKPVYPIVPKMAEKYDCIVIASTNEMDYAFLKTVLELETNQSFKGNHVGQTHVIKAETFCRLWRARNKQLKGDI